MVIISSSNNKDIVVLKECTFILFMVWGIGLSPQGSSRNLAEANAWSGGSLARMLELRTSSVEPGAANNLAPAKDHTARLALPP